MRHPDFQNTVGYAFALQMLMVVCTDNKKCSTWKTAKTKQFQWTLRQFI